MNKIIIVYSVMHTGTWFTCSMIEKTNKGVLSRSDSWIRESYDRIIEDMNIDRYCTQQYWNNIIQNLSQNDWSLDDIDILILQAHYKNGNQLYKRILKYKPEIPIIIPIRDPILSLHSKIWRGVEFHENLDVGLNEVRIQRCKDWINAYKRILTLPKEHVFLLPIDNEDSKREESRIQTAKNMASFCDIDVTEDMILNAINWGKVNDTNTLINKKKNKNPADKWENFKTKYAERDINFVKTVMSHEFKLLNKDIELQRLLYNVGYRDLPWWK